ncbi:MAG: DUF5674 family protein [Candidatus Woesebacteria bacterium]
MDKGIALDKLKKMAEDGFSNLVKAVVDVERELMVVGGDLHSDEERLLISEGSKQEDLWGINLYPELKKDFVEFDSVINIRPSYGNNSRSVDDKKLRKKIIKVVDKLVSK